MSDLKISEYGEECYDLLAKKTVPALSFRKSSDFSVYKSNLKKKFRELTGLSDIEANEAENLNLNIEFTEKKEGYTLTRFTFQARREPSSPAIFLYPTRTKKNTPLR